jgi:hypothetical protein
MASRIEQLEENYGKCLADAARVERLVRSEIGRLERQIGGIKEDMKALAKYREKQGSETHLSVRPLGISVTLKNVAPWALVLLVSLAALIVALVKR